MPEGRQSPPPERQSGRQQQDPPGSGQGVETVPNKREKLQEEIEHLTSNPKGPMEDFLPGKFSKGEGNEIGKGLI